MNLKNFQILILRNGYQVIQGVVTPPKFDLLGTIVSTFSNISELKWFKTEVIKAREKGTREYTGQNTFECFVEGDLCELGHEDDSATKQRIPTNIVLEYIDECIKFYQEYESGEIPGIIPRSKSEDWVIVPKEYVKDEFLNNDLAEEE